MASEYIWIFVRFITWHPNIFGYSFVSILWYSLITAVHCIFYHRFLAKKNAILVFDYTFLELLQMMFFCIKNSRLSHYFPRATFPVVTLGMEENHYQSYYTNFSCQDLYSKIPLRHSLNYPLVNTKLSELKLVLFTCFESMKRTSPSRQNIPRHIPCRGGVQKQKLIF